MMKAPNGRPMDRREAIAHLRIERMKLRQRHLVLKREQRAIGHELAEIEDRLVEIEHGFGLLGATDEEANR